MNNDNIIQGNIKLNNQAIIITPRILILSNSSSGLYEFRNEVVEEDKPLGTAGSLKLIPDRFDKPFIVTN